MSGSSNADSKGEDLLHRHPHPRALREPVLHQTQADANVSFLKGKVAKIEQGENGDVKVTAEDIHAAARSRRLRYGRAGDGHGAHGAVRSRRGCPVTDDGFIDQATLPRASMHGDAQDPRGRGASAQDATGVVMKSIQSLRRN